MNADHCSNAVARRSGNGLRAWWRKYLVGPDMERQTLGAGDPLRWGGPGVYFLYDDAGAMCYVGQARYVNLRLGSHCRRGMRFAAFGAIDVPEQFLNAVEASYIHALRPPKNTSYPPVYREDMAAAIKAAWGVDAA